MTEYLETFLYRVGNERLRVIMKKTLSIVLFFGLTGATLACARLSLQAQTATAMSPQAVAGHEVFSRNCLQCHAVIEGQYSFGPNLAGEMRKKETKKSAKQIREILENGKGKMPSFKEKLTDGDTNALIAYIRTL